MPKVAPAQMDRSDALASARSYTSEKDYIEQITHELVQGTLDLRGGPWLHPCDPHREALDVNASRRASGLQPLNAIELRDLVFRPSLFVWAPRLLHKGPPGRQNVQILVSLTSP